MNKTKLYLIPLILILSLGFFLRTYRLSSLPPGLTWDEAGLGYNAYSILKTGRDEHGAFLPLIFKSFGDYKPGLYVYLALPSLAILGLNEFAVRLPSAIFGTLAILGIYLLANLLFNQGSSSGKGRTLTGAPPDTGGAGPLGQRAGGRSDLIGILAALLLAISPWHIHFSRGAWEVNVFTTVLLFSIYFFLKSLKNSRYLLFSILLASSTILIYQGAKLLTPLIFLSLAIIYFQPVKKTLRSWLAARVNQVVIIFSGIFFVFFFILNLTGPAGNRLARLSIFGYKPPLSGNILFHNQALLTTKMIASRYLYYFSPEVLFYQGKVVSQRGHLPKQGMLYLTDALLLFLGLIALMKQTDKSSTKLIISFLLLAPLPASLTLAEFSTIRALPMVIPLSLISALGLYYLLTRIKKIIKIPLLFFIALNVILGLDIYFNHSFTALALEFNYGYKQAFQRINSLPQTGKIIFTDVYGQPYIYYLFYNKFNPAVYQKINSYIDQGVDVGRVDRVGDKIEFHQFGQGDIFSQSNTWFVGSIGNIKDDFNPEDPRIQYFSEIKLPGSAPIFRLVKTN